MAFVLRQLLGASPPPSTPPTPKHAGDAPRDFTAVMLATLDGKPGSPPGGSFAQDGHPPPRRTSSHLDRGQRRRRWSGRRTARTRPFRGEEPSRRKPYRRTARSRRSSPRPTSRRPRASSVISATPGHAGGPGALRAGLHHLHAYRLAPPCHESAVNGAPDVQIAASFRGPSTCRTDRGSYRQEGQERPGSARGDPAGRRSVPHPGGGARRSVGQRGEGLRADLEAHHRLADDRRRGQHGAAPRGRRGGRRARRRVSPRPAPRSATTASGAPIPRAPTPREAPRPVPTATPSGRCRRWPRATASAWKNSIRPVTRPRLPPVSRKPRWSSGWRSWAWAVRPPTRRS